MDESQQFGDERTADDNGSGLTRRRWLSLTAAAGGAAVGLSGAVAAEGGSRKDVTITSHDGTELAATVYRPAGATEADPVPVILHSHGWSGTRTSSEGAFAAERDRGFGVLSFDQRGHGESGGQAYVQSPDREGRDVIAVLDHVAALDWVARGRSVTPTTDDAPALEDDPMVFAMGGSYGGGYQLVGALTETRREGYTRFDGLAPEITWFDLTGSLAPEDVVRSTWVAALYAAGASMVPQHVHEGFAWGTTTGEWPDGDQPGEPDLESRFFENGPSGFVYDDPDYDDERPDGVQLDVPTLFGQGLSDNLFNLNQAWHNYEEALTERARQRSAVVGYNGGHALPNVLPPGQASTGDACSGSGGFAELRLQFFEAVRDGDGDARDVVGSPYSLTTADGSRCVELDALDEREALAAGVDLSLRGDGEGGLAVESAEGGAAATTTGVGAPAHLELDSGPLTVAGVPTLSAAVTTVGVDQRLFASLSVGASPATARVVQNNVMPLHEPSPVTGAERTIELPGVAVDVPEGEQLYLTLSAVSDMFAGHGSVRTPGLVVLEDLTVDVPLTDG